MDWNWTAFIAMFLLFISADRVAGGEETPMAYEVLQQFDFPIGHLPKGATGYELNNLTGRIWAKGRVASRWRASTIKAKEMKVKTVADLERVGLGLISPLRAIDPGLVYDLTEMDEVLLMKGKGEEDFMLKWYGDTSTFNTPAGF